MKRYLVALILCLPVLVFAYQSPGTPNGFVNDFAGMLKPETISSLNQNLTDFARTNGSEISVVTIAKLEDETIETYAEKLFQEWGIGKAKEDNGILLLISRDDREMRIEVGYGLEPVVTDLESSHIISDVLAPAFREGNFDQGVNSAIARLETDIKNGGPEFVSGQTQVPDINLGNYFTYVLIGIVYLSAILGRSKSWWAGGLVGGMLGIFIGLLKGFIFVGLISLFVLVPVGFLLDYLVSKSYSKHKSNGTTPPWWIGGGRGGGGGGFGGFGGGMSGGGGSSGRW
jgi:uncharacterized protein